MRIVLAVLVVPAVLAAQQTTNPPEVQTSGSGRVVLPADRAIVRISIATRASAASDASSANGPVVKRVQDTLRVIGLVDRNARVVSFGVAPTYNYRAETERLTGYEARTAIELNVRDVPSLGRVLDAVLAAGASEINSIAFVSDTAAAAKRTALQNALTSARDEAQALAIAAGGRLGALKSMNTSPEGGGGGAFFRANMLDEVVVGGVSAARGMIPAVQRDVVVSASVYARWAVIVSP
jgi:uncharacterized protein YggE